MNAALLGCAVLLGAQTPVDNPAFNERLAIETLKPYFRFRINPERKVVGLEYQNKAHELDAKVLVWVAHLPDCESIRLQGPIKSDDLVHLRGASRLKTISVTGDGITDKAFDHLSQLPSLETLIVAGKITRSGLDRLVDCKKLRWLHIEMADDLRDEDVPRFEKLTDLRHLELRGGALTSKGIAGLGRLSRLTELLLSKDSCVDDDALEGLSRLEQLETLELSNTTISDKGAVHLGKLRRLKHLKLVKSKLTDQGLVEFRKLENLESLDLLGDIVGDGILNFVGLTKLKELTISEAVRPESVLALMSKQPDLYIEHGTYRTLRRAKE
jgi:Leucine-rich repeat (LRR) protein